MAKPITQHEARRLRARVRALEELIDKQRASWAREWPGGTHIGTVIPDAATHAAVKTARRLRHAVIAMQTDEGRVLFYALPLPASKDIDHDD